jgi:hypothetical protein
MKKDDGLWVSRQLAFLSGQIKKEIRETKDDVKIKKSICLSRLLQRGHFDRRKKSETYKCKRFLIPKAFGILRNDFLLVVQQPALVDKN